LSILLFIISGVGFFDHHFSPTTCARFGYLSPVFKGTTPVPYAVQASGAEPII
jgi:hypothetical protein